MLKKTKKQIELANRPHRLYASILADTHSHDPVTKITNLSSWTGMGLFCNGICVGVADLCPYRTRSRQYVHTDATEIYKPFRKHGHGIVLYKALIHHAKRLGAKRIYSGTHLNKYSQRMWEVKLAKIYNVKRVGGRCSCTCRCRGCQSNRRPRFYIDL